MKSLLPIFQLDLVLLPGEEVELHIFEDRFKALFKDLGTEFAVGGIVRSARENNVRYGTTFELIETLNTYQTGESDVLIRGVDFFEIQSEITEEGDYRYPVAEVEVFETSLTDEVPTELLPLANEVLKVASSNENRAWSPVIYLQEIFVHLQLSSDLKEEFLQSIIDENWKEFLDGQMQLFVLIQQQMKQLKGNFLLN